MRESKIKPVPCGRVKNSKMCGKLPRIINPAPDLYYAVCSCSMHNANFGRYQFLGSTPERAVQQWNDFHLYNITHNEELIEKIAQILGNQEVIENVRKNTRPALCRKNSRGQMRPKHYSANNRGKKRTDSGKRKSA